MFSASSQSLFPTMVNEKVRWEILPVHLGRVDSRLNTSINQSESFLRSFTFYTVWPTNWDSMLPNVSLLSPRSALFVAEPLPLLPPKRTKRLLGICGNTVGHMADVSAKVA